MTPEERARAFFETYPPPDAQWYTDEVLIPGLAAAIRAAIAEDRASDLTKMENRHPGNYWLSQARCRLCEWENVVDCIGMSSHEIAEVHESQRQALIAHHNERRHPERV